MPSAAPTSSTTAAARTNTVIGRIDLARARKWSRAASRTTPSGSSTASPASPSSSPSACPPRTPPGKSASPTTACTRAPASRCPPTAPPSIPPTARPPPTASANSWATTACASTWASTRPGLDGGLERGPPARSPPPPQPRPRHPGHLHRRPRRHAGRPRLLRQDHLLHVRGNHARPDAGALPRPRARRQSRSARPPEAAISRPPSSITSGVKPRATRHGVSLRPYLEGREDLERPIFCERERGQKHFQRLIRTVEWKYSYASTGASQLYNIAKDPGETNNLIDAALRRAPCRRHLHARLAQWMRETGDRRQLS